MNRFAIYLMAVFAFSVCLPTLGEATEEPIARIVVLSNTYITTQLEEDIVDEHGANRGWIAKMAATSAALSVETINRLNPDATVVMGSLTWSGSDEDFDAFDAAIAGIKGPVLLTPGLLDTPDDSMDNYKKHFSKRDVSNTSQVIAGVRLMFAGDMGNKDTIAQATERLTEQAADENVKATLLFGGRTNHRGEGQFDEDHDAFWKFIEQSQVGARFEPARYRSQLSLTRTLPLYKVGSTGWSLRGKTLTLVTVYKEKITIEQVKDPGQPSFQVVVPNPVNADRLVAAEADPHHSPSYTTDLKAGPDLTFAVASDPQLSIKDRGNALRKRADACIADLNMLKPTHVFFPGDLVEHNLPEEWGMFDEMISPLTVPYTLMPGNHDVLFLHDFEEAQYNSIPEQKPEIDAQVKAASKAAAAEGFTGSTALYRKYTGLEGPQVVKVGDSVFICLEVLTQRIEPDEIVWLREQLEATRDAKHVFVLGHYPVLKHFGNNVAADKGGAEVLELLKEFKVAGYIFGHRHRPGLRMHEGTAHILVDNMKSILLVHTFDDHLVIARKDPDSPLYEKVIVPEPRSTAPQ